jgi:hypothetical protein
MQHASSHYIEIDEVAILQNSDKLHLIMPHPTETVRNIQMSGVSLRQTPSKVQIICIFLQESTRKDFVYLQKTKAFLFLLKLL